MNTRALGNGIRILAPRRRAQWAFLLIAAAASGVEFVGLGSAGVAMAQACAWQPSANDTEDRFPTGGFHPVTGSYTNLVEIAPGIAATFTSSEARGAGWGGKNLSGLGQSLLLTLETFISFDPGTGTTYLSGANGVRTFRAIAGTLWSRSNSADTTAIFRDVANKKAYLVDFASTAGTYSVFDLAETGQVKDLPYLSPLAPPAGRAEYRYVGSFDRAGQIGLRPTWFTSAKGRTRVRSLIDSYGATKFTFNYSSAVGPPLAIGGTVPNAACIDPTTSLLSDYLVSISDDSTPANTYALRYKAVDANPGTACNAVLVLDTATPPQEAGDPVKLEWRKINHYNLQTVSQGGLLRWAVAYGNPSYGNDLEAVKYEYGAGGTRTTFSCAMEAMASFCASGCDGRANSPALIGATPVNKLTVKLERAQFGAAGVSITQMRSIVQLWSALDTSVEWIHPTLKTTLADVSDNGTLVRDYGYAVTGDLRPQLTAIRSRSPKVGEEAEDVVMTLATGNGSSPACGTVPPLPGDETAGLLTPNPGLIQVVQANVNTDFTTVTSSADNVTTKTTYCYTKGGALAKVIAASPSSRSAAAGAVGTDIIQDVEAFDLIAAGTNRPGLPGFDIKTWQGILVTARRLNDRYMEGTSYAPIASSLAYPIAANQTFLSDPATGATAAQNLTYVPATNTAVLDPLGRPSVGIAAVNDARADRTVTTTYFANGNASGEVKSTSDSLTGETENYAVSPDGKTWIESDPDVASLRVQSTLQAFSVQTLLGQNGQDATTQTRIMTNGILTGSRLSDARLPTVESNDVALTAAWSATDRATGRRIGATVVRDYDGVVTVP